MSSYALLRTNVALTTNVKLMVSSNYDLYLDSIVSTPELSDNRYKKFQFNKDTKLDNMLPVYYKNTPTDISYKIKFDNDVENMSTDFANQYDDLYQYGARNIVDNKYYTEEFEYFAPLHFNKNGFPNSFIIFRIDGPGLLNLDKDNFRNEILEKLKFVKRFDLTPKSKIGQWVDTNLINNKYFPKNSLYIDFRRMEFSSWGGIDYERGGYTEKSFLLDSTLEYEQPFLEMEQLILDGYKRNKVIYPNIVNFSFLFDDTPATKETLRKWSLNRYLGFYIDELNLVYKASPNQLPQLKSDIKIDDRNVIYSPSSDTPFLNEWDVSDYPYIELDGQYYIIEKFEELTTSTLQKVQNTNTTFEDRVSTNSRILYKIISDKSLQGKIFSDFNKNLITIDPDNYLYFQNGSDFSISGFEEVDVWLIEIGDKMHKIVLDSGKLKLHTDYGFEQSKETFKYFINKSDSSYSTSLSLVTNKDKSPIEFSIFKCKFTNIKDFDTDIIDTEFSRFEYSKPSQATNTDEPKFYVKDLQSTDIPKDIVRFKFQNKVIPIPTSSEYTANSETFRLQNNTLSKLWRKNSERLKWGFDGSISSHDYPYLLNNSVLADGYNRSPNSKDSTLGRSKRNLDHFYTINSDSNIYDFHSLHIQDSTSDQINTDYKFELDKYLGLSYSLDYFDYFFRQKHNFSQGLINLISEKFSIFQTGDNTTPNITLFRGLKFKISEVDSLNITSDKIEKINLKNSNKFVDWKFSILCSNNQHIVSVDPSISNKASFFKSENVLRWRIIDEWKNEKQYFTDDVVWYEEILFRCLQDNRLLNPNENPFTRTDLWVLYDKKTIFYSPLYDGRYTTSNVDDFPYVLPPLVYFQGNYYYSDGQDQFDFWSSIKTYDFDDLVTYGGRNWKSLVTNNKTIPVDGSLSWELANSLSTRWSKVEHWSSDRPYGSNSWDVGYFGNGDYVVYEDVVYGATSSTKFGVPPNLDSTWNRIYSLVPDTKILYGPKINNNSIIKMNGKYYECVSNSYPDIIEANTFYNFSLDNGIYVIINEKFKNILINIYINDNTYSDVKFNGTSWEVVKNNLKNTNRDDIYQLVYSKLSTNNLMNSLNDLSNNFGFSDLIKYIVVGENDEVKIYDFNDLNTISSLPYLLICESPDEVAVRIQSNILEFQTLKPSEIKAKKLLNESEIESIDRLNYYNGMHLATLISRNLSSNLFEQRIIDTKNEFYYKLYRFSGYYSPIFKNIQLFDSPTITNQNTNYKFDTDLTYFGLSRQKIVSKVNRNGNLLRFRNQVNLKSVYPMIDEYGYHIIDFFIFKSTWDFEYHYECSENDVEVLLTKLEVQNSDYTSTEFKNHNSKLL